MSHWEGDDEFRATRFRDACASSAVAGQQGGWHHAGTRDRPSGGAADRRPDARRHCADRPLDKGKPHAAGLARAGCRCARKRNACGLPPDGATMTAYSTQTPRPYSRSNATRLLGAGAYLEKWYRKKVIRELLKY